MSFVTWLLADLAIQVPASGYEDLLPFLAVGKHAAVMLAEAEKSLGRQLRQGRTHLFSGNSVAIFQIAAPWFL